MEDQAEYDSVLISSAGDLVAALANTLGADFQQAFGVFFPLISKYYVRIHACIELRNEPYIYNNVEKEPIVE